MKNEDLQNLVQKKILLLDGATGTELQKAGMPQQEAPELWVLKNPETLADVQRKYIDSGSQVIYTCTFGANKFKLAEFGFKGSCSEINRKLAQISRKAAGSKTLVAGAMGPTGLFIEPFGQLPFEDAVSAFKEQIKGLEDGGADLIIIETMMDIQEARAALIAAKEISGLPAIVSMTFTEDGRTLTGTCPSAAVVTLQSLGAAAVGCNCSIGPDAMLRLIEIMGKVSEVPLLAKPNAGLPRLINGKTVFEMSPAKFASFGPAFVKAGCSLLGGCCGTAPDFISELKNKISKISRPPFKHGPSRAYLSSSRKTVEIGADCPIVIVGERINPTGKQLLKDELKTSTFKELRRLALEQKDKDADILDVNVGAPGVDEKKTLPDAVSILSPLVDTPLCLDSSDIVAIEKALRIYPGRALINSISFESRKIRKLLPAAAKYGAMFILLPLGDDEIPETAQRRKKYVERIMNAAEKHGFRKKDVIIDGLVMAVSSNQSAAHETLALVEWATQNSFNTILGLSNVSFGLPERKWINAAFLAMAAAKGLTCAIMNPTSEELASIRTACDVLTLKDKGCVKYVGHFQQDTKEQKAAKAGAMPATLEQLIFESVVKGDREHIGQIIDDGLAKGIAPRKMVDEILIPAINKVGDLFDRKEYYLPQLIMSAETMKAAFEVLEPMLASENRSGPVKEKTKVILATVKGDIHDIGKNIVALMLKNYGFDVIDLGKDVGHAKIIEAVRKSGAKIVGLSALMTTTMSNMVEIIGECRKAGLRDVKFLVGGAVVDQAFADEIGADGYAPDSVEAVKLVKSQSLD